jgi:hypothetical protein
MGKTFNVYLKDRGSSGEEWGEGDMYEVGLQIKGLFDEVCRHPDSDFSQSDFWWDPAPGTILDHELLVYFLPDASKSVIAAAQSKYKLDKTKSGNTYYYGSSPRITEVYVNPVLKFTDRHILLAKLCFHELMHNKLEPFDVHGKGGGGLATDSQITSSTPLTEANKKLMAKALSKRVRQYKGAL